MFHRLTNTEINDLIFCVSVIMRGWTPEARLTPELMEVRRMVMRRLPALLDRLRQVWLYDPNQGVRLSWN